MLAVGRRTLGVLVYLRRGAEVLLMHRHKSPNLGLWIAPGGKVELDESPQDTARREVREETGLEVETLRWRGFCTEVTTTGAWQWFLFIYVTDRFHGELKADLREGTLRWVPVADYLAGLWPMPQADRLFAPAVLDETTPFFEAKFVYDEQEHLLRWTRY